MPRPTRNIEKMAADLALMGTLEGDLGLRREYDDARSRLELAARVSTSHTGGAGSPAFKHAGAIYRHFGRTP
jgi:hypothetical protein